MDVFEAAKRVKELEGENEKLRECLAGFMATAAVNGAYLEDDMKEWVMATLNGKKAPPAAIWRELMTPNELVQRTAARGGSRKPRRVFGRSAATDC